MNLHLRAPVALNGECRRDADAGPEVLHHVDKRKNAATEVMRFDFFRDRVATIRGHDSLSIFQH